jgi:hypothetical protein
MLDGEAERSGRAGESGPMTYAEFKINLLVREIERLIEDRDSWQQAYYSERGDNEALLSQINRVATGIERLIEDRDRWQHAYYSEWEDHEVLRSEMEQLMSERDYLVKWLLDAQSQLAQ